MSKAKLFGKKLEELTDVEVTVDESRDERTSVDEGNARDDSLSTDGWKQELEQRAKNLDLAQSLGCRDLIGKYMPLQNGYVKSGKYYDNQEVYRKLEDKMWAYVSNIAHSYGLTINDKGVVLRKDLVEKVEKAGNDLLKSQDSITNRDIAFILGVKIDKAYIARIRGTTLSNYEKWGWTKSKEKGRVVYKKK